MMEIKGLGSRDYQKTLKKIEKLKKFPPKVVENRILFETKDDFSGNGRIFYEYLINNGYDKKYEIIWLVKEPEKLEKYKRHNVRFVRSHEKNEPECRNAASYRYMLSSKYIFYDQSVNWIGMTRKNQVFVNLWHGCAYAVNADRKKIFFDYCLTPGKIFNLPMKEAFGCTMRKMLPLGYPYYDDILRESVGAKNYKKELLEKSGSTKLVLWWPVIKRRLNAEEVEKLDERCRQNQIQLLIKNTDLGEVKKNTLTNIRTFKWTPLSDKEISIYELLGCTDGLISDYSSFLIDFLLVNRPMAYIMTELDDTKKWVFDHYPDFMPGKYVNSSDDICSFMDDLGNGSDIYREKREEAAGMIFDRCDNYCQRIADHIFTDQ